MKVVVSASLHLLSVVRNSRQFSKVPAGVTTGSSARRHVMEALPSEEVRVSPGFMSGSSISSSQRESQKNGAICA